MTVSRWIEYRVSVTYEIDVVVVDVHKSLADMILCYVLVNDEIKGNTCVAKRCAYCYCVVLKSKRELNIIDHV